MSKAAFLVDGQLEQRFIQSVCPGSPVKLIACNGKSVTPEAIAKRVASHCRLLSGKYYPIVIWTDLEGRQCSCEEFCAELHDCILNEGVKDQFVLGVADRMIENWIIADKQAVLPRLKNKKIDYPSNPDGFNGKAFLKKNMPHYHETTVGVDMLSSCHSSNMECSPSFLAFKSEVLSSIKCWWLSR